MQIDTELPPLCAHHRGHSMSSAAARPPRVRLGQHLYPSSTVWPKPQQSCLTCEVEGAHLQGDGLDEAALQQHALLGRLIAVRPRVPRRVRRAGRLIRQVLHQACGDGNRPGCWLRHNVGGTLELREISARAASAEASRSPGTPSGLRVALKKNKLVRPRVRAASAELHTSFARDSIRPAMGCRKSANRRCMQTSDEL